MKKSYMVTHEGNGSRAGLYFATLDEAKRAVEATQGGSGLKWMERAEAPGTSRTFVAAGFVIVECDAPLGY
jgi:hypothetical protein